MTGESARGLALPHLGKPFNPDLPDTEELVIGDVIGLSIRFDRAQQGSTDVNKVRIVTCYLFIIISPSQ